MMHKLLHNMGPKSFNLFSYKSEKTNHQLRDISIATSAGQSHVQTA